MKRVWVYGRGYFWNEFKVEVERDFQIIGFLDSYYEGQSEGLPCHRIDAFDAKNEDYILVMISKPDLIFEVIRNVIKAGVSVDKILFGNFLYGEMKYGCTGAKCTEGGNICLSLEGEIEIEVSSGVELIESYSTIVYREYDFNLNNGKKCVVLDVGANIGDTALFFLKHPDVEKVYSFEPFQETYMKAEKNLERYIDSPRLELLNYGLSDINEKRDLIIYDDMSIGLSTNDEILLSNKKLLNVCKEDVEEKRVCVEVKRASQVLENIMSEYGKDFNIVFDPLSRFSTN